MAPMFDLAGPLLRKLYPDFVFLETVERAPPASSARRKLQAVVDRLQTADPVPPKPAADDETRCRVALAEAIPPREWESLRLRREHATAAMYSDPSIAVAATR